MRYDAVQIWMLTATFVVPVLIGASCEEFMKALAVTAVAMFVGNLLYDSLFGGWDGFGSFEGRLLASAATVPLSVPLGAVGFGLRRLWNYVNRGPGLA
jgi:hypothetical protein